MQITDQVSVIIYDVTDDNFKMVEQLPKQGDYSCICETLAVKKSGNWLNEVNKAINDAKGTYIYFQSGYDSMDVSVIEKAIVILEKYQLNIVYFPQVNESKNYVASKNTNVTGVYDVKLEAQFDFGVFNFLVRKMEDHQFDELMIPRCAYIKYFLEAITTEGKFGYLKEGCQTHRENELDYFEITTYDEYVMLYTFIKNLLEKKNLFGEKGAQFIQTLVVKCIGNLLKKCSLIPENYDQTQKENLANMLSEVMDGIQADILVKYDAFSEVYLCYLLSLRKKKIDMLADKGCFGLYEDGKEILSWKSFGYHVSSLRIKKDLLKIKGFFCNPASYLLNFTPYLLCNGERKEITTSESLHSYCGSTQKIANYRDFELEIPCNKPAILQLRVKILEQDYPVQFFYHPQIPVNTVRGAKKLVRNGTKYFFNENYIRIKPLTFVDRIREQKWDVDDYKRMYPREAAVRNTIKMKDIFGKRKIVLFVDSLCTEGFYELFLKECEKKDRVKRYYCSTENLEETEENLIYGGERHKIISALADIVVTTSPRLDEYKAFGDQEWQYFRDMMKYQLIYAHAEGSKEEKDSAFVFGMDNLDGEIIF